jgi:hypothetical protein
VEEHVGGSRAAGHEAVGHGVELTKRPVPEIEGLELKASACTPEELTETRAVCPGDRLSRLGPVTSPPLRAVGWRSARSEEPAAELKDARPRDTTTAAEVAFIRLQAG